MNESPRETWAAYLGGAVTIIPAMIVSGFMPKWNMLPFTGWLAIATVGAGIAGAIATPRWARGALAGALAGAGVLLGMSLYVALRAALTGNNTFLKIELGIGAVLGAAPGMLLFTHWARVKPGEDDEEESG
ncbi:MAG: hypothetical protein HYU36_19135 [Planctomycetes bacterium]|nr:hypothetical protein [Planctomycetota bacterium]